MQLADKNDRIINFLVDNTIIALTTIIMGIISMVILKLDFLANSPLLYLIYFLIFFIYYIYFELTFRQTPGKIISKTFVMTKNNRNPGFRHVFLRTLIRLTGLDVYSYLFGTTFGMHDMLSNTKVVKK